MGIKGAAKSAARRWVRTGIDESHLVHAALDGRGTMIDVGAHHGYSLEPFLASGWTVHAFEPDPSNRQILEQRLGGDPNLRIVPAGVSDAAGSLPLYASEESTGVSSLAPFTENHVQVATVDIVTLSDYLSEQRMRALDFLKVDVEGHERDVLAGHDWNVAPRVAVVEFEDSKTKPRGYMWHDLAGQLVGYGYEVLVSEWFPIERYGTQHAWRRFARYPTELVDPDGWGNLIAWRDPADGRRIERISRQQSRAYGRGTRVGKQLGRRQHMAPRDTRRLFFVPINRQAPWLQAPVAELRTGAARGTRALTRARHKLRKA